MCEIKLTDDIQDGESLRARGMRLVVTHISEV